MYSAMNNGFPELTDSFLLGQDIMYAQFNSINFYVEDTDQEHFYFNILKKLFPNILFEKIFPLNGKDNVVTAAKKTNGDKSKVYIVDLDFDEILNNKENEENLFYLRRYSIENYLCHKTAIFEIIREKSPKIKDSEIEVLFNLEELKKQWKILLTNLSSTFIIIQKYSLGKEYFGINCPRDFDLRTVPPIIKNQDLPNYLNEVEILLKNFDSRFSLNAQIKKLKCNYNNIANAVINIPGKYILLLLKHQLESMKLINQMNLESFTYKLSKDCCVNDLLYLKNEINDFTR
jgi:hypothetical protein